MEWFKYAGMGYTSKLSGTFSMLSLLGSQAEYQSCGSCRLLLLTSRFVIVVLTALTLFFPCHYFNRHIIPDRVVTIRLTSSSQSILFKTSTGLTPVDLSCGFLVSKDHMLLVMCVQSSLSPDHPVGLRLGEALLIALFANSCDFGSLCRQRQYSTI